MFDGMSKQIGQLEELNEGRPIPTLKESERGMEQQFSLITDLSHSLENQLQVNI